MQVTGLFNLIVKIAVMMALGYFLRRRGLIDDAFKRKLGQLLLAVIMPLNVIGTGNSPFDPAVAGGLVQAAAITAAYYGGALLLMRALAAALPLARPDKGLLSALAVFANTSFIGYPISFALFGNEGVLYAVVYNLGWQLGVSLFGARLLDPAGKTDARAAVRDPLLWAAAASVLLFISPFRLPAALAEAFVDIGAMSVPVSMMIVGCSIAEMRLASIFTMPGAYLVSFLRLCALPLAMLAALWALGLRGALPGTMVLLCGLPAASLNVVFAEKYGANVNFAATAVVQSTLFMVLSLPLLTILMGRVF